MKNPSARVPLLTAIVVVVCATATLAVPAESEIAQEPALVDSLLARAGRSFFACARRQLHVSFEDGLTPVHRFNEPESFRFVDSPVMHEAYDKRLLRLVELDEYLVTIRLPIHYVDDLSLSVQPLSSSKSSPYPSSGLFVGVPPSSLRADLLPVDVPLNKLEVNETKGAPAGR